MKIIIDRKMCIRGVQCARVEDGKIINEKRNNTFENAKQQRAREHRAEEAREKGSTVRRGDLLVVC